MFKLKTFFGKKKQDIKESGDSIKKQQPIVNNDKKSNVDNINNANTDGSTSSLSKTSLSSSIVAEGDDIAVVNNKDSSRKVPDESVPPRTTKREHIDIDLVSSGSNISNADLLSGDDDDDDSQLNIPDAIFIEQNELKGYKLINKIGTGAFSKVFRAIPSKETFVNKHYNEVAIKVIKKDDLASITGNTSASSINHNDKSLKNQKNTKSSSREQVLKEVAIHQAVSTNCENIVSFVEFQESEGYYYIVQELLSGGEIFSEIVRLTYFSEDLARHVIKQLAIAVKHLHSMGVVHRDIKPENLLFETIDFVPSKKPQLRKSDDPNTKVDEGEFTINVGAGSIGTVKLVDFGLSKQIHSANTQTPCGTIGYTAPEVVKDEKYSMKVDMWGIGCVLYTILCGFPPFYDEKINVLTEKIANGNFTFLNPWWDEISDGAKHAVSKLLEVNPENRYDADEFLNDPWLNNYDCLKNHPEHQNELVAKQQMLQKKKKRMLKKVLQKDNSILYSPAAVAMRDAFDISNAVQRIEDDRFNMNKTLDELNEEEELDIQFDNSKANPFNVNKLEEDMFELKLNTSTIINRRKNKNAPLA
ncbi:hypothetical protein TPHA_0O00670 [Tetrapisispora phaffii CBS 4417]|uniref:non-specific serine/threonine protein kinase n=1 Tax=Tetrapisispora phaffii (strain ATCC 24235 / CBS 4417 / NBRC 1672 / NRRL Y-8282 / UCD 70-5) TaxID=1071381 RepID=G8C1K8_TETPH|nr:hypothetical protein TPHA_0O00670 [Tetrapisispora phaffii CBS 4417]CCE66036.1 hypothetical protein TPHA_0O00670 [Tetrapisispora phaffii CBS 4417]